MPTSTYTPIASVTLSASASEVVFSGLPQTYRDLILIVEGNVTGSCVARLRFNGDSGSNYTYVSAAGGNANNPYSTSGTTTYIDALPDFSINTRFDIRYQIMDFSATDKHKTVLSRFGLSAQSPNMAAGRWANTSAITSLTMATSANAYASGTTFNLFGVIS